MVTFITSIIPFLLLIPFILLAWWLISLLLNIKSATKKQLEQNDEIIELLKKLNNKDNFSS